MNALKKCVPTRCYLEGSIRRPRAGHGLCSCVGEARARFGGVWRHHVRARALHLPFERRQCSHAGQYVELQWLRATLQAPNDPTLLLIQDECSYIHAGGGGGGGGERGGGGGRGGGIGGGRGGGRGGRGGGGGRGGEEAEEEEED